MAEKRKQEVEEASFRAPFASQVRSLFNTLQSCNYYSVLLSLFFRKWR